jgi:hypothetical protein
LNLEFDWVNIHRLFAKMHHRERDEGNGRRGGQQDGNHEGLPFPAFHKLSNDCRSLAGFFDPHQLHCDIMCHLPPCGGLFGKTDTHDVVESRRGHLLRC